jgi:Fe-S-cluster containining protein
LGARIDNGARTGVFRALEAVDGESDPPDAGPRTGPRSTERRVVLRRHHLSHLPRLEVNASIFETRYAPGSSPAHCDGTCCSNGVKLDVGLRDQILANADLVQRAMGPQQDRDTSSWFEETEEVDPDFPSGRCVGTQVRETGCVFLDAERRCVLQSVTIAEARPGFDLKPFFCSAFPVTVSGGALWIDELCLEAPGGCCRPTPGGPLRVVDVCETELRHVLGNEGLDELRLAARE